MTPQTIYKWRKRDSVEDRSHTPHRLQTTLTPAQEAVAVELRRTLLVSLDDLLDAAREGKERAEDLGEAAGALERALMAGENAATCAALARAMLAEGRGDAAAGPVSSSGRG